MSYSLLVKNGSVKVVSEKVSPKAFLSDNFLGNSIYPAAPLVFFVLLYWIVIESIFSKIKSDPQPCISETLLLIFDTSQYIHSLIWFSDLMVSAVSEL